MEITVNGKRRDHLGAGDLRAVETRAATAAVEGAVLPPDEASRAYRAGLRRHFGIMAALGIALGLAILIGGLAAAPSPDRIKVILTGTVCAGVVVGGAWWRFNHALTTWTARLTERVGALPPSGTPVRVDTRGLSIGARAAQWPALALAVIEVTERNSDDSRTITIDRLVLANGAGPIVLDRHLMQNGAAIVDTAYCKVVRERGVTEL
ncbi:MAG: hypothetical protein P4M07_15750 [Xanthobacteraceae bacterium]|nr:hypothetical protein [Xanthobacteraceae bacterium]